MNTTKITEQFINDVKIREWQTRNHVVNLLSNDFDIIITRPLWNVIVDSISEAFGGEFEVNGSSIMGHHVYVVDTDGMYYWTANRNKVEVASWRMYDEEPKVEYEMKFVDGVHPIYNHPENPCSIGSGC